MLKKIILTIALALLATSAFAQPNLKVSIEGQKEVLVIDEKTGEQRYEWQKTTTALPGDVIRYVAKYRNEGTEPTNKVRVTLSLVSGQYVPYSSTCEDMTAITAAGRIPWVEEQTPEMGVIGVSCTIPDVMPEESGEIQYKIKVQ